VHVLTAGDVNSIFLHVFETETKWLLVIAFELKACSSTYECWEMYNLKENVD